MIPLILASNSPRRQEIMKQLHIPFTVEPAELEETYPEDIPPRAVPEYLAVKKAEAVMRRFPKEQTIPWILGFDTAIIHEGRIYGKPHSPEEARSFLRDFSGKTHTVVTGLALYNGNLHDLDTRTSASTVTFKPLTEEEIEWYIEQDEWHGVAGAYRIQGLAQCFITRIEGSYSGIVGLPICELYDILNAHGNSILE